MSIIYLYSLSVCKFSLSLIFLQFLRNLSRSGFLIYLVWKSFHLWDLWTIAFYDVWETLSYHLFKWLCLISSVLFSWDYDYTCYTFLLHPTTLMSFYIPSILSSLCVFSLDISIDLVTNSFILSSPCLICYWVVPLSYSFFSPSWILVPYILNFLTPCSMTLILSSILSLVLFFCAILWTIYSNLSSILVILSFDVSNLLLKPSIIFKWFNLFFNF